MNVMNLIKKGPKKLRGPAAAAAKKKNNSPIQKKIIDKRNPFRSFTLFPDDEMYEEMNNFVQNLSPTNDRELIKMFNILKTGIPWPLVKPFFIDFDQSNSNNIINFFDNFLLQPQTKTRIENMKKIINLRHANITHSKELSTHKVKEWSKKEREKIKKNPQIQNNKNYFFKSEFLSKCEQEYRRAPWMYKFTNEPIRGFALRHEIPEYLANETPLLTTELINTPFEGNWYKASMKWYKDVCNNGRTFDDGNVAYITASGNLIIETQEMFDTSKKDWNDIVDIEFSPINQNSFDAAKAVLISNPILSNYSSKDINAILASIANNMNFNYDMAKRLSWILVFLSQITKEPQIHHYRVKNYQYKPENLILLDRYTLLPEIYKNPNADSDEVEYILKSRRRFIENQFYSRLKPIEIGARKRTVPLKPEVFKYLTTDAYSKCPTEIQDVIYYEENGTLYCFNRLDIKNKKTNPITGKPFSLEFLQELNYITSPKRLLKNIKTTDIIQKTQPEMELAPGLFQKLKEEIELITPIYCSMCNIEIFTPKYKSIKGTQRVQFCEKECFDQFRF